MIREMFLLANVPKKFVKKSLATQLTVVVYVT